MQVQMPILESSGSLFNVGWHTSKRHIVIMRLGEGKLSLTDLLALRKDGKGSREDD
jgi:hypothetical protein